LQTAAIDLFFPFVYRQALEHYKDFADIASTDQLAQPFIRAMTAWYVTGHSGLVVILLTELPELA